MDIEVGNPAAFWWLWVVAACLIIAVAATVFQRRAIRRFATANLLSRMVPQTPLWRNAVRAVMLSLTLLMLVVTLLDIRWGKVWREVPQTGIEVVFVLDVSRSMLAEDATPNRLRRAKQQINDTVDAMAGDRIGLVVFAGETEQVVPLTSHYKEFKQSLEMVGPESVPIGGSRLGEAISSAAESFLGKTNDHKAMIVFTDGEDQESNPIEAARKAYSELGIRIFTVGLGDMDRGAPIPVAGDDPRSPGRGYVQYEGEQVLSRQQGAILREVAEASDGAYIPAGTKLVDMADVYHGYISDIEEQAFEVARINQFEARFQWFLGAAIGLLLAEIFVSLRPRSVRMPEGT